MPHICQILGVNSVTNIELDKGNMPAPIIRNAYWFESFTQSRPSDRPSRACQEASGQHGADFNRWPDLLLLMLKRSGNLLVF
ncbi:hypothetical protein C3F00_031795 [Pseudomonas sp. MWU13-2860]|nr:hypothetical protein C3F00_031795 [Pseudomonas sp. MWU13-2860]